MKTDEIRERFLDFFRKKDHRIVASDSLVPSLDPTLLFTSAGMNQFKEQFLGKVGDFRRAASCQKCLRTDDLDKVGKTAGHHTFFEMQGKFSFGGYFKKEAILWAWEFVTRDLKLKPQDLWVSVYKDDAEAYKIWQKDIGIKTSRIIKLGAGENFWPSNAPTKGPNGPCGPCSEIFYDQGKKFGCGKKSCGVSCDCNRFVEVWNLVFTQYNRQGKNVLKPLPNKNIDTGMGLERIAAVMQKVPTNFEIDIFKTVTKSLESIAGKKLLSAEVVYLRNIIADHIRAICFAIDDGVSPSNEARGYVVRKLIRKAFYCGDKLNIKGTFLYKLLPAVAKAMSGPYPDINIHKEEIAQIIQKEEENFQVALQNPEPVNNFKRLSFTEKNRIHKLGEFLFESYSTYGLPPEINLDRLKQKRLLKDFSKKDLFKTDAIYQKLMEKEKKRSKAKSKMTGDIFVQAKAAGLCQGLKATKFLGYQQTKSEATILRIISDGALCDSAISGQSAEVIFNQSPFYAESGGQVSDSGVAKAKNASARVVEVRCQEGLILHKLKIEKGKFSLKQKVSLEIDFPRRMDIARNHTATHLLQAALRQVLGKHVKQQGSLVEASRLRFDFSHFKALDKRELLRIEELVNQWIRQNFKLDAKVMPKAEAKSKGALAFFAEKYEDKVRVVSVGKISSELCGGTHLKSSGEIGLFKITSESSVAAGLRRIEAVTGEYAYNHFRNAELLINDACSVLNANPEHLLESLQNFTREIKSLYKQIRTLQIKTIKSQIDNFIAQGEEIKGTKIIIQKFSDLDIQTLRDIADIIREKVASSVVILGSTFKGRATLVAAVGKGAKEIKLEMNALIKRISSLIEGGGGGRRDFAQAGGKNTGNLDKALQQAAQEIKKELG